MVVPGSGVGGARRRPAAGTLTALHDQRRERTVCRRHDVRHLVRHSAVTCGLTAVASLDVHRLTSGEAIVASLAPRPGHAAAPLSAGHRGRSNDLRRWREDRDGGHCGSGHAGGGGRVSSRAKFVGSTVRVGQERARHPPKTYRAVDSGDGQGSPHAAPVGTASCVSRDRCGTALTLRERQMAANGRSFVVQLPRTPLKSVPSAGL